jgi:serine/threonine protein kinase
MEFFDGMSLHSFLKSKSGRRLSEEDSKKIFKELMKGLAYIHGRRFVHR